jgi:hypothetical protein
MIVKEKQVIAGFSYMFGKFFALTAGVFGKPPWQAVT